MKKIVVSNGNQLERLNSMLSKTLNIIEKSMYKINVRELSDLADDLCAEIDICINTSPYSMYEDDYLYDMFCEYRKLVDKFELLMNRQSRDFKALGELSWKKY